MKANAPKRKIFDAVDVLVGDSSLQETEKAAGGVQMIPVEQIRPFHDHPFRLYEGERLQDMVDSIRNHGVLSPVIVLKQNDGYEMLAGHNRLNAAKIVGLKEVPAVVKNDLTDEEAYVYVIETNLIQRSFSELLPSERAVVLSERYEKISCQGRRNDIRREIEILNGRKPEETCGHDVHKSKSRDSIGEEYGMTGRNIARYMRVNQLNEPLKELLDNGEIALVAAVDLSYLEEKEQDLVAEQVQWGGLKISSKMAKDFREAAGTLDLDRLNAIMHPAAGGTKGKMLNVKMPAEVEEKYFSGMKAKERTELVMQALDAWFAGKEAACVQC